MGLQFGAVLVFAVVAVLFALVALLIGAWVRPRFPNAEKASIYECGELPIGAARHNFNPRFYLIALAFIVFEVDIALTLPVVVVYMQWIDQGYGWIALSELVLFTAILIVGLVWAWAHGDLEWVKKLSSMGEAEPAPDARAELPATTR
jgi:NADH-quinone oxidoreductase subunit A